MNIPKTVEVFGPTELEPFETHEEVTDRMVGNTTSPLTSDLKSHQNPSTVSSSEDEASYMDKYNHVRAIIVEQSKQLQDVRIRCMALETMQALYKENEAENSRLRKEKLECEGIISVLQSRLASFGMSTTTSLDDSDVFVPGPNKDLVRELSRENAKLKQSLKYATIDPYYMEDIIQENRKLKEELSDRDKGNAQIKEEIDLLRKTLRSSEDQKDLQLVELQQQLQDINQAKTTSELLCHSLSLESVNLKQKLQEMASACQQLATQMEKKSRQQQEPVRGRTPDSSRSVKEMELISENARLQTDLLTTSQRLKGALDANTNWQKFSDQREDYVKQLVTELNELKRKHGKPSSAGRDSYSISAEQQQHMDELIQASKIKVGRITDEKEKAEDEARALRIKVKNLQDVIARMREQLSASDSSAPTPAGVERTIKDYVERIQMLEHQVRICAEDFDTERKDREKAQTRATELEREMLAIKEQLHHYQQSQATQAHYDRLAAQRRQEEERRRQPRNLVPRGYGTNMDYLDGAKGGAAAAQPRQKEKVKDDLLKCPRCHKAFAPDCHNELLEHMDNCVD